MRKKMYYEDTYKGYPIKCETNYPCYAAILSKLFEVIQVSKNKYTRPIGFHVRYRLNDSTDGRIVTDKINKYFKNTKAGRKKPNTFKPYWIKVSELDPDQDGSHQHMAIVIDGKKATKLSLHCFFSDLMKRGYLDNYLVIPAKEKTYASGVNLEDEKGVSYFFHWLSYIAKVNSKEFISQTYSSARLS